jgi:AcrR family transcriptional regulator
VSSKVKEEPRREQQAWRGEPLPRGRHKLATEVVRASQRERLIRAMLETVAEDGYESTTVPQVVARARVSRNAFYEFFADKPDCFIAACDEQVADELLGELLAAAAEPDWVRMMRRGVGAYLEWWASRPALSRAYFIGLPAAGERAIAQRERAYARFRRLFLAAGQRARSEQPGLAPFDEFTPRVLVLAITELVAEEVRAGRTGRLPELENRLAFTAIKLLADDETARRAVAI